MSDSQPDYRQERPPQHDPIPAMLPSCPLCGSHNEPGQSADEAPVSRQPKGGTLAERYPFLCGVCWTVFEGTDHEWRRMREERDAYVSALARLKAGEITPSAGV